MPRKENLDNNLAPIVKWAGGKRQLLPAILPLLPLNIHKRTYCEPFLGGGALLWALHPKKAIVNDLNTELMNMYRVVRDMPQELIATLKQHINTAEYFYRLRVLDREPDFTQRPPVERAARFIYLNKTCYNGLFRVNSAGEFNSPYGHYKRPNFTNEANIFAVHEFLNTNRILLENTDYQSILDSLPTNTFVYLDPPYHPLSETSNFTGYVQGGWKASDQERLCEACQNLDARGIAFMQSNSDTPLIRQLYADFHITVVQALRAVNSKAEGRGAINELIICNYDKHSSLKK